MRSVAIAALLAVAAFPVRAEVDYRAVALAAVDEVAIPGYRAFGDRTRELERKAAGFCAAPAPEGLEAVRAQFHAAMDAWQGVQIITFGPVEEFHRGQRVHFWPDKKNAGDRQMRLLLKERNSEGLEGARIAFASVAIQGLPALETLLFADGDRLVGGDDAAFRCRVVTAIAANLSAIGRELAEGWGEFRPKIAGAGGPGSPYVDHRQAASQVFNAMHGHLEAVAEVKLAHPLGDEFANARKTRAENWRSERSLRNIVLNLRAVGAVARSALVPALPDEAADRLLAALDEAVRAADRVPGTMERALESEAGWQALSELKAKVKLVARVLETQAGTGLGLQVGFNALDGD